MTNPTPQEDSTQQHSQLEETSNWLSLTVATGICLIAIVRLICCTIQDVIGTDTGE